MHTRLSHISEFWVERTMDLCPLSTVSVVLRFVGKPLSAPFRNAFYLENAR